MQCFISSPSEAMAATVSKNRTLSFSLDSGSGMGGFAAGLSPCNSIAFSFLAKACSRYKLTGTYLFAELTD